LTAPPHRFSDLGYLIGWWNGNPDTKSAVNLSAGLGLTSSDIQNFVLLDLPDPQAAPGLYTAGKGLEIIHALIDVFAPESAVWTSQKLIAPQKEPDQPMENGDTNWAASSVRPVAGLTTCVMAVR
jgi:hypothetical protein